MVADHGPVCWAQLRSAAQPQHTPPAPRWSALIPRSPSPKRARPATAALLPEMRRGRLGAHCQSLATARLPGAAAVWPQASARAGCPLPPRWGFLWGWTKDISWEERGNVPSMPRFVVRGDFLPPQQQRGPYSDPRTGGGALAPSLDTVRL